MMASIPPGWYPDPNGMPCEKFWNGIEWTDQTRPTSTLHNKPAPGNAKVGFDQNERILFAILGFSLLVLLFFVPL
jgi:hypothetical protein